MLAQGIELITWTFDPLESRNARFNFHKLGATCDVYLRNLYGAMRDTLNAGLPSDRFQVDWRIASPRVEARLRGERETAPSSSPFSSLMADGVPLINPLVAGEPLRSSEKAATRAERRSFKYPPIFKASKPLTKIWRSNGGCALASCLKKLSPKAIRRPTCWWKASELLPAERESVLGSVRN